MNTFAQLLRTNKYLRFLSSVKLAVPLMLVIVGVVATGTIFESMYNSEYAKILIYQTSWFFALTVILWLNICLAMLSRWPFKKHHAGFVLTHIGMMTVLVGGCITGFFGIDGQLRVTEGAASSTVILSAPILGYQFKDSPSAQTIDWPRRLSAFSAAIDDSENSEIHGLFWIGKYMPFAAVEKVMSETQKGSDEIGLSFKMKSQFFDVSEWLHSTTNPSLKMGPATIEIKLGQPVAASAREPQGRKIPAPFAAGDTLEVLDLKSGKSVAQIPIAKLQGRDWTGQGVTIHLKRLYRFASVGANKLIETEGPEPNPALELEIKKGGTSMREVLFYKFKNFSINKDGVFGLRLQVSGDMASATAGKAQPATDLPQGHPAISAGGAQPGGPSAPGPGGNLIQFWVNPQGDAKSAVVVLTKNGKEVGRKEVHEGEAYQTPWMGMVITLASIVKGGEFVQTAVPVAPQKGTELPPSAVEVHLKDGSKTFWLLEGTSQDVQLMDRPASIFYGRKVLELPFALNLKKFTKHDYPGTETAMSYESLVEVNGDGHPVLISMNEPLKKNGYTLYQSSYVLQPGQPPESIFSVNWDPGRPVKYAGSVILAFGIILFTLMRSRRWKTITSAKA